MAIAALTETGIPQANCTATAVATSVDFRTTTRASGQPHALMANGANVVACARRKFTIRLVPRDVAELGVTKVMPMITTSISVATATDRASHFAPLHADSGSNSNANPTTRILPTPV